MARSERPRVTRGASTPINRSRPENEAHEPRQLHVAQPPLAASTSDKQLWRQKHVIEPRLNKLIKAIRMVAEAGNDDFYGFTPAAKEKMTEIIRREIDECFKSLKYGTRGSRYVVIEELGDDEY